MAQWRWKRVLVAGVLMAATSASGVVPVVDSPAGAASTSATVHAFGDAPAYAGPGADVDVAGVARTPAGDGLWLATPEGRVHTAGSAPHHGHMTTPLNEPVVGIAATPTGAGYWLVAADGGIFSFGDARFFGSTGGIRLNQPVVGIASTVTGAGYWLVASDGGIFAFGDARFFGSTGAIRLNQPVVGMARTVPGAGYWLVASDGGIFAFGDARFFGSTGAIRLNQPVVGMAATPAAGGYWLTAADGGVFAFGDAGFFGSAAGAIAAGLTAAGIVPTPSGAGYWIAAGRSVVRIMAAGDVHGEGPVRQILAQGGNPISEVAGLLSAADVTAVNLETPASAPGTPQPKQYVFLAPVELLTALKAGGVDVVSLANNHALDHGATRLLDTRDNARRAGLVPIGAGANAAEAYAPAYVQVRGRRIGFVGLSRVVPGGWAATATRPGVASVYDEQSSLNAVREAARRADAVVVMIHWGVELSQCPDGDIIRLARRLHDAGATIVAGHHPHVLEGITASDRQTTMFSLGNFVWYHDRPPSNATGVLDVGVDRRTDRVSTTLHTATVGGDGRPRLRAGADAAAARQRVADLTPGGPVCRGA